MPGLHPITKYAIICDMAVQTNLNVSLTRRLMGLVRARVESGRYQSASEVIREGLRLLEERDRQQKALWAGIRQKDGEGQAELKAGGVIPGDTARAEMEAYINRRKPAPPTKKRARAKKS